MITKLLPPSARARHHHLIPANWLCSPPSQRNLPRACAARANPACTVALRGDLPWYVVLTVEQTAAGSVRVRTSSISRSKSAFVQAALGHRAEVPGLTATCP